MIPVVQSVFPNKTNATICLKMGLEMLEKEVIILH